MQEKKINPCCSSEIEQIPTGRAGDAVTGGCLVLEGGGLRGVYSVGVMDALMQENINFECCIGVSAGVLNAYNYISGQIGRGIRVPLNYRHDKRYFGFHAFLRSKSPFGFDFMFNELLKLEYFDIKRFKESKRRLIAVATNCLTGQPEYFEKEKCNDFNLAARASATLPIVSKPVFINGIPYLDGGCSCKIPYQWAMDNRFKKIVVVRTRNRDTRKKNKKNILSHLYDFRYPNLAKCLSDIDIKYNRQCDELNQLDRQHNIFMIAPTAQWEADRLEKDLEILNQWYWLGYYDCKTILADLKSYLTS